MNGIGLLRAISAAVYGLAAGFGYWTFFNPEYAFTTVIVGLFSILFFAVVARGTYEWMNMKSETGNGDEDNTDWFEGRGTIK